jgi:hypothetical protein
MRRTFGAPDDHRTGATKLGAPPRATASTGRRRCIRRQPDAYSLIGNATGFVIAMIGSLVMGSLRESRKLLTDRSR